MTGEPEMIQLESDHGGIEVRERSCASFQLGDVSPCRSPVIKSKRKRKTFLILCRFVFSPLRIHPLDSPLNTPNFDHIWSCGGKFEFL